MRSCALSICALILSLVLATPAVAQPLRIGYVDMKDVLDNAPQVLAGRALLEQEFRARNDAIESDELRAEALDIRLQQGDISEDGRLRAERELRELNRNISRRKEDLRDELSFRRTEEIQRLEGEINIAVQEIARRNGYDLILSSPVIFASEALDITDLVLEQLEVEFAADQLELATP